MTPEGATVTERLSLEVGHSAVLAIHAEITWDPAGIVSLAQRPRPTFLPLTASVASAGTLTRRILGGITELSAGDAVFTAGGDGITTAGGVEVTTAAGSESSLVGLAGNSFPDRENMTAMTETKTTTREAPIAARRRRPGRTALA